MPRGSSIQKPTTLLTIKKLYEDTNVDDLTRGEIVLIVDGGYITGDMRIATGNLPGNSKTTDKTVPFYPVGSIIYFAGSEPPDGFLVCDGASYDVEDYPELANYLRGILTYSSAYNGVDPGNGASFKVPNYTVGNGKGGLFIRNLNIGNALGGNTNLPDYQVQLGESTDGVNFNNGTVGNLTNSIQTINRTFGSIQNEMYPVHDHPMSGGVTGATGENHVHHYFGAPGATNGHQIGYTYLPSNINRNYTKLVTRHQYQFTDENIAAEDYANSGVVGKHIHTGYLGFGQSYTDANSKTTHNTDSSYDNSTETRPINYSLLFCIKY